MHSLKALATLAKSLADRHGLDEETAGRYANLIGDCPEFDSDDRLVVRDEDGEIIALLATQRGFHLPPDGRHSFRESSFASLVRQAETGAPKTQSGTKRFRNTNSKNRKGGSSHSAWE